MSVSTAHVLHGIVSGSAFISEISNARPVTNIETLVAMSAGLPFPLFVGTMASNPALPFDTPQIKTILDSTNALTGITDLSGGNTDLYFKALTDEGRRVADATTSHIRFRMSQAFMSLDRISASNRGEASASVRIGTTYDGTNAPLVAAGSLALAGTPTSAEHFVAGPVSINGSALVGIEDISIEFNRQVIELSSDGEIYNTFVACASYSPVITLRTYTNIWPTYGIIGTALTSMSVYLRKVSSGGRVADGTAQHIKFTATAGLINVEDSSGGTNDPSMTSVRLTLVGANASTEPIAVDTASTIT